MRAVIVGESGEPELVEVPEPAGEAEIVRVLACGLVGVPRRLRAPVAALAIVSFLTIWWLTNLAFAAPGTREIPFGDFCQVIQVVEINV